MVGEKAWFGPRRFGWGWAPVSPEGGIAIVGGGVAGALLRRRGQRRAGPLLAEGMAGAVAHTAVLTRAIRTRHLAMEEMGRLWLPVRRHWRLNERHYGDLTGLNKAETRERYGDEQFTAWRRSYAPPPPP